MIDIEQTSKSHGLRMNVEPEDTISGTYLLKATSDVSADKIKLWIDGKRQETRLSAGKRGLFRLRCPENESLFSKHRHDGKRGAAHF